MGCLDLAVQHLFKHALRSEAEGGNPVLFPVRAAIKTTRFFASVVFILNRREGLRLGKTTRQTMLAGAPGKNIAIVFRVEGAFSQSPRRNFLPHDL